MDWQARAASATLFTGTGKGRKLTPAGEALFRDMMDAGAGAPEMARTLGMAPQSNHNRTKKRRGGLRAALRFFAEFQEAVTRGNNGGARSKVG